MISLGQIAEYIAGRIQGGAPTELVIGGPDHLRTSNLRLMSAPLRPRPDFVIPGAQKAGTTSLFNYLTSVTGVEAGCRKELHFPDQLGYHDPPTKIDELYYRSFFPVTNAVTGEATPYYLFHPLAARHLAELARTYPRRPAV